MHLNSLDINRDIGDRQGEAASLNNLGLIAQTQGDVEEAKRLYLECMAIMIEIGDLIGVATSQNNLGNIAEIRDDLEEAKRFYLKSLDIKKDIGDRQGVALTLSNLGIVAERQGELEEAEQLQRESMAIMIEIGDRQGEAHSLGNLGLIAKIQGNLEEAEQLLRQNVRISLEIGIPLHDWFVENGYTDPDAEWDFPPDEESTPVGSDVTQNFNAPVEYVAARDVNINYDGIDPKVYAKALAENERLKESRQTSEESKESQPPSESEISEDVEKSEPFSLVCDFENKKLVLGRDFYANYRVSSARDDYHKSRDAFHELIQQGRVPHSDQIKAAHNLIGLLRLARKRGHAIYENDRHSIDLVSAMNRLIPLGKTTEIEGLVPHEIALVRSMRAKFLDETDYEEHDCTYEQIFDDLLLALRELVETRFKSESLDNNAFKDAQDIAEQARNMVAILPNPDDQQEKMVRVEYKATYLLNAMNTRIPGKYPPELFESKSPFDEVEYPLDVLAESE